MRGVFLKGAVSEWSGNTVHIAVIFGKERTEISSFYSENYDLFISFFVPLLRILLKNHLPEFLV